MLAGTAALRPWSRSASTSEQMWFSWPGMVKQWSDASASIASRPPSSWGKSPIVRDGCRFLEPRQHRPRHLRPLGRHPGHVREHARPQVRHAVVLGRRAKDRELSFELRDGDVLARPVLLVGERAHRCRHARPSRRTSSSAACGPHEPAT